MAHTAESSNHYKYILLNLVAGHTFKAILMDAGFVFDKDTHATLADVTSEQLVTGSGYTQDYKVLTNIAVTEDDVNDRAQLSCDDISFTATGGDIGPFSAMVIYDSDAANAVVGCISYDINYTIEDGSSWVANDVVINLGEI